MLPEGVQYTHIVSCPRHGRGRLRLDAVRGGRHGAGRSGRGNGIRRCRAGASSRGIPRWSWCGRRRVRRRARGSTRSIRAWSAPVASCLWRPTPTTSPRVCDLAFLRPSPTPPPSPSPPSSYGRRRRRSSTSRPTTALPTRPSTRRWYDAPHLPRPARAGGVLHPRAQPRRRARLAAAAVPASRRPGGQPRAAIPRPRRSRPRPSCVPACSRAGATGRRRRHIGRLRGGQGAHGCARTSASADENVEAYGVATHRHQPEIAQNSRAPCRPATSGSSSPRTSPRSSAACLPRSTCRLPAQVGCRAAAALRGLATRGERSSSAARRHRSRAPRSVAGSEPCPASPWCSTSARTWRSPPAPSTTWCKGAAGQARPECEPPVRP